MRYTLVIILLLCYRLVFSQSTNSVGIDNNPYLNTHELEFLKNRFLSSQGDTVDLRGKKIGFVTGSAGNHLLSKSDFFKYEMRWKNENYFPWLVYVAFNDHDKSASGGYDGLIKTVSKLLQKNKIIKKLRAVENKNPTKSKK